MSIRPYSLTPLFRYKEEIYKPKESDKQLAIAMKERAKTSNALKKRIDENPRLSRRAGWRPALANIQVQSLR